MTLRPVSICSLDDDDTTDLFISEGVMTTDEKLNHKHHGTNVQNLYVINLMKSFVSRGFVRQQFSWNVYYWFLTAEGVEYLREYLHVPADIVPATLKSTARSGERPGAERGDRPERGDRGDRRGPGGDRRGCERLRFIYLCVCFKKCYIYIYIYNLYDLIFSIRSSGDKKFGGPQGNWKPEYVIRLDSFNDNNNRFFFGRNAKSRTTGWLWCWSWPWWSRQLPRRGRRRHAAAVKCSTTTMTSQYTITSRIDFVINLVIEHTSMFSN
jgi:small subunit ribosomal protein S10e